MTDSALLIPALLVVNLMTYAAYWWDKRQAIHREWRVPEAVLLLLGAIGGSPAAYVAQKVLRHKNRKQPFKTFFWLTVLAQLYGLLVYLAPPIPVAN